MANTQIETRILLCTDTSANWASSAKVLLKGEFGIELTTGTPKIKVGDGVNTFADLPYATMTPEEINNLVNGAASSVHTHANKDVLDAIQVALTSAMKTNYDIAYTHSQAAHAPSNAEANVQSDWNVTDTTSDAYIKNKPTISEYSLKEITATSGYSTSYQLIKDGTNIGDVINIPKDMVVSGGSVKTVTTANTPYSDAIVGDKYIDLIIANADSSHVYIPVKDLVDVYTGGDGITVNSSDVISVNFETTASTYKAPGTASVGTSKNVARADHVHPAQTSVSGNAGTATKLSTPRTIAISGAVTGTATSFDGSANVTIKATSINMDYLTNGTNTLVLNGGSSVS